MKRKTLRFVFILSFFFFFFNQCLYFKDKNSFFFLFFIIIFNNLMLKIINPHINGEENNKAPSCYRSSGGECEEKQRICSALLHFSTCRAPLHLLAGRINQSYWLCAQRWLCSPLWSIANLPFLCIFSFYFLLDVYAQTGSFIIFLQLQTFKLNQ